MYPEGIVRVDQPHCTVYLFRDETVLITRRIGFRYRATLIGLAGDSSDVDVAASGICALVDVYLPQAVASRKVLVSS